MTFLYSRACRHCAWRHSWPYHPPTCAMSSLLLPPPPLPTHTPTAAISGDPYAAEPTRHPALVVRTSRPFNAETPAEMLTAAPLTPNDMFYVRHHLPVPQVDAQGYRLKVCKDACASPANDAHACACPPLVSLSLLVLPAPLAPLGSSSTPACRCTQSVTLTVLCVTHRWMELGCAH